MADKQDKKEGEELSSTISTISSRLTEVVTERADAIKYAVIAALVLLALIVAAIYYFRNASATRVSNADNAFYRAEFRTERHLDTNSAETFAKLAKEYAGLPAAARAQVMLFSQSFGAGDYAGAVTAARDFIKANPQSAFANRAQLALGQALLMQNKLPEAEAEFRRLSTLRDPSTYAEAKLGLAQTLEQSAEAAKASPEEYRRRLATAAEEYSDIAGQARAIGRRGFWPPAVLLAADYAQVTLRDKLAGHEHKLPLGAAAASVASTAAALPSTLDTAAVEAPAGDPLEEVKKEAEADAEAAVKKAVDEVIEAMEKAPATEAAEAESVPMPPEETSGK